MNYLNDVINPLEMMNWGDGGKIFIDAPMGSGKSHFVKTRLIPWAIRNGKRVLILCNRLNLQAAYVSELTHQVGYLVCDLVGKGVIPFLPLNWVQVETYQSIANRVDAASYISSFQVIVCDEVHAFYSDSTFAPKMYEAYKNLIIGCKYSLTLFISATAENIFPHIYNDLKREGVCMNEAYVDDGTQRLMVPGYYTIQSDFTYFDVHYAETADQIISAIIKDRYTQDKWLILVPSCSEGKEYQETLLRSGYKKNEVFFLNKKNASTNGASISEDLVTMEAFEIKVLITTLVIEAGISIKDKKLKNIVDLHYTKEAFIQSLGRKRVSEGERINLYLLNRQTGFFQRKLIGIKRALNEYSLLCNYAYKGERKNYYDYFAALFMRPENLGAVHTFAYLQTLYYNGGYWVEPMINPFSIEKHQRDSQLFELLISGMPNEKNIFLRYQMEWLGLDYTAGTWLDEPDEVGFVKNLCAEIINQKLQVFANIESMDGATFKKLREEITSILHEFMPQAYRVDRNLGINGINAALRMLNIPFTIENIKTRSVTRYKVVSSEIKMLMEEE